ncbi:hypothetical protein TNCV_2394601 [Trichonephila clavipes]|nr:hypothetical protein TNCV_2394601 [Trichonephila clavipes]
MTAYTQRGKTSVAKQKSGLKEMFSEIDRRELKRIVISKKRTAAANVTTELNQHPDCPLSIITVRRRLHKQNIYINAAIPKQLITNVNAKVVYSGVTRLISGRKQYGLTNNYLRNYNKKLILLKDKRKIQAIKISINTGWFQIPGTNFKSRYRRL